MHRLSKKHTRWLLWVGVAGFVVGWAATFVALFSMFSAVSKCNSSCTGFSWQHPLVVAGVILEFVSGLVLLTGMMLLRANKRKHAHSIGPSEPGL